MSAEQVQVDDVATHVILFPVAGRLYSISQRRDDFSWRLHDLQDVDPDNAEGAPLVASGEFKDLATAIIRLRTATN